MEGTMIKNETERRSHVAAWIGMSAILLLWVAYIALLAFMIRTAHPAPDARVNPKMAEDLMRSATNMVGVLLPAGFVLAVLTLPIMMILRRRIRHV